MPARDHALIRNLPNTLTVLRLLAVPVFVVMVVDTRGANLAAGLLFIAAAITDFFDGFIARKMGVISQFGKVVDPLADRLLVGAATLLLCIYDDRMLGWEFLVVIWRDVGAVYGFARARRHVLPDVSATGKVGTAMMMAGLAGLLVLPEATWPLAPFWLGIVLSVVALGQYVWRYRWVLRNDAAGPVSSREDVDVYSAAQAKTAAANGLPGEENDGAPS